MKWNANRAVGATAVVLAAATLAACSTSGTSPSDDGKSITLGTDDTVRIQPVIDAFEAANPGVTVEVQSGGNSYQEFLRTRLASNTAPDVLRTFPGAGNVAGVLALDESGSLADLSEQSWTKNLSQAQLNLFGTEDDRILSVPVGSLALGAVYNDATLADLGLSIPETYTEVMELCDAAKAEGKVAFAIFQKGGGAVPTFAMVAPLVYGPDPQFTAQQIEGDVTFSDSGWKRAYEIQVEMNERGCFQKGPNGTDWNAAAALVAGGDAVATFAFSDTTALEDLSSPDVSFLLAPFPTGDDPAERYLAVADSNGFGVNANAENPELAMKFVEFIGSAEGQNLFAAAAKGAPALPNAEFSPESANQQTIVDYQKSGMIATWPDQEWPGPEVVQSVDLIVQGLVDGSVTPDSAVQSMDEAWSAALSNAQ
jgi:raffinose/stachyose/melibiose transport system substrate-binding protein